MAWQIVIDFENGHAPQTIVHQIRNFGEDLSRACNQEGWASIATEDIDSATNQLTATVSASRHVRRTVSMVRQMLDEHFLARYAHITEVNIGP